MKEKYLVLINLFFYLLCLTNDVIPDDQFPKQWQKVSRLIKYLSDSNGEETMIKKFGAK